MLENIIWEIASHLKAFLRGQGENIILEITSHLKVFLGGQGNADRSDHENGRFLKKGTERFLPH